MLDTHPRLLAFVLLSTLLLAAAFQGSRGLFESTEGRYAECARQTRLTGHWGEPVLNGQPHWTKPPLTYMCIGAGISLLGTSTWAARAFLVPAFVLTVLLVYGLGRLLWGREAALYAAMVYGTSPLPAIAANCVSTDTLLVFWEACSMFLFWWAVRSGKKRCFLLMWAALGLGFLTKGPVSLMPLFGIIPVHVMLRRRDRSVPAMFSPAGLAVFFVTGFSWYLVEGLKHPGLIRYWLVDEVVKRNLEGKFQRNPEFYYVFLVYLPLLLSGTGPWAVWLFFKRKALPLPRGRWRQWLRREAGMEWIFLILSLAVPFLLFSLSTSRLPFYLLPLFIPLSLAVGKGLAWLVAGDKLSRGATLRLFSAMIVVLVIVKGAFALYPSPRDMARLAEPLRPMLEQRPEANVVIFDIHGLPWYGLQYYLQRTFPEASLYTALDVIDRERSGRDGPLTFLLRRDDLRVLRHAPTLAPYTESPVGDYWVLLDCLPQEGMEAPDGA